LLVLAGGFFAGCYQKSVRVAVTDEALARASEALQEGDAASNRQDYYAALIKYLDAARWNPNSETLFNRLGITFAQLQFYDEARRAFQRSLDINPRFPFAFNNLGSISFLQKNFKKAEKYFIQAISLKSDETSFYVNLGSVYLEQNKPGKAMEQWRKAVALDANALTKSGTTMLSGGGHTTPMEKDIYLARFYASMGNVELAIENLQRAFSKGFSDVKVIDKQPDFDPIRRDSRFVEFMKSIALLGRLRNNAVTVPAR